MEKKLWQDTFYSFNWILNLKKSVVALWEGQEGEVILLFYLELHDFSWNESPHMTGYKKGSYIFSDLVLLFSTVKYYRTSEIEMVYMFWH